MRVLQLIPAGFIDKQFLGRSMRFWIPVVVVSILIAGIFSPLFDLSSVHGVGSVRLYAQHYYFDGIAGLGGYWASTLCEHAWHRITLFLMIDALCTLALVTLVG
jgi:hypothetical protein